jgi:cobalt-zinc-cadmium efflux system outer membrane protein
MKKKKTIRTAAMLALLALAFSTPAYAKDNTQIASFIQHIWKKSPLVLEAQAKMNAARAQARADSKWRYNPEIEFEGEDKDGTKKTKLVGISQTIDWSGKFLAAGKVAKYELQAATAEHDNSRQTIALDVLSALADYQAAKEVLKLSDGRTKLMERFASLASKSFKAGDIDQSEYNLARLAFSEALIGHADAQTLLGESKLLLESAVGFSAGYENLLPSLSDRLPSISTNGQTPDQLVQKLPAMRVLQAQTQASKSTVSRARRERMPDPTVSLKGGSDEGDNIIGLSVSIPLNIFNSYGAQVDVAKYQTTAQEQSLVSAFHSAKSRLESSRKAYELSSRAWNVWKETGAHALEEQIDILDRKFKVGELSATDYLVQVRQSLNTEIAAKKLHSKAWKSWFAWLKASGNIEQWLRGE